LAESRHVQIDAESECDFNGKLFRIRSEQGVEVTCDFFDAQTLFALKGITIKATSLRKLGRRLSLSTQKVDVLRLRSTSRSFRKGHSYSATASNQIAVDRIEVIEILYARG
jgi:hypothetical protein